jgi:hypothetical protein
MIATPGSRALRGGLLVLTWVILPGVFWELGGAVSSPLLYDTDFFFFPDYMHHLQQFKGHLHVITFIANT